VSQKEQKMSDQSQKVYAAHPAAELFPFMPMNELQALAEDIKTNGLIEPIVLLDDLILDGRHRLKACGIAGITPRFAEAELNGSSPTLYVISKNLKRRHLTQSERATIGAEIVPLLQEEAKKRVQQGARNGGHASGRWHPHHPPPNSAGGDNPQKIQGECRQIAATALQVGKTQVQEAIAIKRNNPEQFERVKRGEISVNAAYRKVIQDHSQPKKDRALPASGTTRRASMAKAETERMVKGLSQIRGICRGLADIKMSLLVLTPDERKAWAKTCFESMSVLRNFAKKVRQAS
jgi:hypothetical protein